MSQFCVKSLCGALGLAWLFCTKVVAIESVIAKWQDQLQGAGVWTCQHAQKMVSSLRFDEAPED